MVNIVLFGAPGCGKGTQAQRLKEHYGIDHVSTGEVIRDEIRRGTELGQSMEAYIKAGQLAPDEIVIGMIDHYVTGHMNAAGCIFDGFPRTTVQAEEFDKILAGHGLQVDIMIDIHVPEEELIQRILLRGKDSGRADDAAVILPPAGEAVLCSTDLLTEGVDFDLTYFPLKHLGYKAVTVAGSDILAMNARPSQLMVSLGVSAKMSVEALQELYEGIAFACREQGIDLVGGDTKASVTGLVLSLTAAGHAPKERIVSRGGAQQNDLICISGNLGAAYMGLRLLEREKRVLADVENPEPKFGGYEYLLEKYLKPRLRRDIVDALAEEGIVPTSMIDLSDGLASDLLQICKASKCGARIYLDRIPIAKQTYALAEELHADPVVAALNGGEDHELLFTVPLAMQEQVMKMGCVDVIGHITPESTGAYLVTPDGSDIRLRAQGFAEKE